MHESAICGGRSGGLETIISKVFVFLCFPDIHYFHCLRIVELLKGTEASTKNIFGRYSSQRMKASVGDSGNAQLEASSPGGQRLSDLAEDPVEMPPCNISSTFSLSP